MKPAMAVRCDSYEIQEVTQALSKLEEGLSLFEDIQPGSKVLIKPNLLKKSRPEDAVTTHAAVVEAVANCLIRRGAIVSIWDSPGSPIAVRSMQALFRTAGMEEAAQRSGATLCMDQSGQDILLPHTLVFKNARIATAILEADAVVNVAKLKTHAFMRYTGATKNLYGCIPGTTKSEYHLRIPQSDRFAQLLVDLAEFVAPVASIIDGVLGMEGEGPGSGTPRQTGCLIASKSTHCADVAGVRIMGWQPSSVPTLREAARRGLCDLDAPLLGDAQPVHPPYQPPSNGDDDILEHVAGVPKPLAKFIIKHFSPRPKIVAGSCVGCKECANVCPAQAIVMKGHAVVDYEKCIRCYCCHEMCPAHAIQIWHSKIYKLLQK